MTGRAAKNNAQSQGLHCSPLLVPPRFIGIDRRSYSSALRRISYWAETCTILYPKYLAFPLARQLSISMIFTVQEERINKRSVIQTSKDYHCEGLQFKQRMVLTV